MGLFSKSNNESKIQELLDKAESLYKSEKYSQALKCYKKAADMGAADAAYNLACFYREGIGCEKNLKETHSWYVKAAGLNHPDGALFAARDFRDGIGCDMDKKEALEYYIKASELGESEGAYYAAIFYRDSIGTEQDLIKALSFFEKSAELGDIDSMLNAGLMYSEGIGCDADEEKAFKWFEKGAEGNNPYCYYYIGLGYLDGVYYDADYDKAFKNFSIASELGVGEAAVKIAHMYCDGIGFEKNIVMAEQYASIARERGFESDVKHIFDKYNKYCETVEKSYSEAAKALNVSNDKTIKIREEFLKKNNYAICLIENTKQDNIIWKSGIESVLVKYYEFKNIIKDTVFEDEIIRKIGKSDKSIRICYPESLEEMDKLSTRFVMDNCDNPLLCMVIDDALIYINKTYDEKDEKINALHLLERKICQGGSRPDVIIHNTAYLDKKNAMRVISEISGIEAEAELHSIISEHKPFKLKAYNGGRLLDNLLKHDICFEVTGFDDYDICEKDNGEYSLVIRDVYHLAKASIGLNTELGIDSNDAYAIVKEGYKTSPVIAVKLTKEEAILKRRMLQMACMKIGIE